MAIRNMTTRTISPAIVRTSIGTRMLILLFQLAEFFPRTDIGDATFVAGDHHLDTPVDGPSVFTSGARRSAHAVLRKDHFSSSVFEHCATQAPQRSDHFVVGRVQVPIVL